MLSDELKSVILRALDLDHWDLTETSVATEVPGWDSLNHVNVISAVESHFGIRFRGVEVLKLKNIGDLQRLVDTKLAQKR